MGGGGGGSSAAGGRSMRARAWAGVRTPQGVGAVLFVVGGAIVGAAVVAWRRHAFGCDGDGEDGKSHRVEQAASEEILDGAVEEKEKFQDDKGTDELHQIQSCKAREEAHEMQEDDEIVMDGSDGEPVEKFDHNSIRGSEEIIVDETTAEVVDNSDQSTLSISCLEIVHKEHPEHNDGGQDTALIQITPTRQMMIHNQQFSEEAKISTMTESAEIIADDTENGEMENVDENSGKNGVENEITLNDLQETECMDNSHQSTLSISCLGIVHDEHHEHNDGAQYTEPTQTTPSIQTMMQQQQFSEDTTTDTVTETAEAERAKGTTMEKNLYVSPSLPSLLKPSEKKSFANQGWNKTGLKLKHDSTKGAPSKGVTTKRAAAVTMDGKAASMAILTLIFAVTIGVNIVMRLYSSLQTA